MQIKVPQTPKYILFEIQFAAFFLLNLAFIGFKTYEKLSIICFTTESEGEWVYSWLDITVFLLACLQRVNAMQISLWHQIGNRPMALLTRSRNKWCSVLKPTKSKDLVKKGKRVAMIYSSEKNILGLGEL